MAETLKLVGLAQFAERYPRKMSGGQQQRVALARALVIRPRILLLDEPLSNLDAKLREEMQIELRQIQRSVGTTTILVTHDQAEAMALSDRIVVMNAGRVEQIARPHEAYERPASAFVANFLGKTNVLAARAGSDNGAAVALIGDGRWPVEKLAGGTNCACRCGPKRSASSTRPRAASAGASRRASSRATTGSTRSTRPADSSR